MAGRHYLSRWKRRLNALLLYAGGDINAIGAILAIGKGIGRMHDLRIRCIVDEGIGRMNKVHWPAKFMPI